MRKALGVIPAALVLLSFATAAQVSTNPTQPVGGTTTGKDQSSTPPTSESAPAPAPVTGAKQPRDVDRNGGHACQHNVGCDHMRPKVVHKKKGKTTSGHKVGNGSPAVMGGDRVGNGAPAEAAAPTPPATSPK